MVVLITGGSSGIGEACAKLFKSKGYDVAISYNSKPSGAKAVADSTGAKIYKADLSNLSDVKKLVSDVLKDFGSIDVLVNNAGMSISGLLQDMTDEQYDKLMNTNARSVFAMCREVLPSMISKKSGSIINVSSMWGEVGSSCETLYSMSKAAIIGFTKALAKEVAPSGIRVNCVSPGMIDTKMNSCYSKEDIENIVLDIPLGRIGTVDDVAASIYFLASDDAAYITGQDLGVNGGLIV